MLGAEMEVRVEEGGEGVLSISANEVRRMKNGAFNAMTDEEDH
ncbi:hypothetical protein T02_1535 [Trichinella nativa]|uniref:Uncharacterized protein n=1 Tax=Trichinella nativa TaxID=6335 RepID=A0A0V1KKF8_9BILA|nr:hypothetical protein T02_1535 [Trichinella nativa]